MTTEGRDVAAVEAVAQAVWNEGRHPNGLTWGEARDEDREWLRRDAFVAMIALRDLGWRSPDDPVTDAETDAAWSALKEMVDRNGGDYGDIAPSDLRAALEGARKVRG